jgi:hypothetical protein
MKKTDLFLLMTILTEQLELELGFLDLFPQLELLSSCSKAHIVQTVLSESEVRIRILPFKVLSGLK